MDLCVFVDCPGEPNRQCVCVRKFTTQCHGNQQGLTDTEYVSQTLVCDMHADSTHNDYAKRTFSVTEAVAFVR